MQSYIYNDLDAVVNNGDVLACVIDLRASSSDRQSVEGCLEEFRSWGSHQHLCDPQASSTPTYGKAVP